MSEVPAEIKPMAPLEGVVGQSQEVYLEVMRAGEALKADLEALLKPFGLSLPQYNVLRILRGAGVEGLGCGGIIERMVVREPDVTRLLGRLQERGLIVRAQSREDRRAVLSFLSREGLRLVEELDEPVAQLHVRQLGHLGESRLHELGESLRAVHEALGQNAGR